MNIDIKTILPNASKSFLSCNSGTLSHTGEKNALQAPSNAKKRGSMNRVESEYAMILEAMKRNGEILRYEFEGVTLRFAGVKYTPDFVVLGKPWITYDPESHREIKRYELQFIEVKGPFIKGNRERAVERFRHAKTYWPEFTFEMHQRAKDGWRQLI